MTKQGNFSTMPRELQVIIIREYAKHFKKSLNLIQKIFDFCDPIFVINTDGEDKGIKIYKDSVDVVTVLLNNIKK